MPNGRPDSDAPLGDKVQWLVDVMYTTAERVEKLPCTDHTSRLAVVEARQADASAFGGGWSKWFQANVIRLVIVILSFVVGGQAALHVLRTALPTMEAKETASPKSP